jgi:hypothetical protein
MLYLFGHSFTEKFIDTEKYENYTFINIEKYEKNIIFDEKDVLVITNHALFNLVKDQSLLDNILYSKSQVKILYYLEVVNNNKDKQAYTKIEKIIFDKFNFSITYDKSTSKFLNIPQVHFPPKQNFLNSMKTEYDLVLLQSCSDIKRLANTYYLLKKLNKYNVNFIHKSTPASTWVFFRYSLRAKYITKNNNYLLPQNCENQWQYDLNLRVLKTNVCVFIPQKNSDYISGSI